MTAISRPANVILVEDNQDLRKELQFQLQHAGFTVRSGNDGIELQRLLDESPCDILVLDVNLPGESGFSIAARLCDRSRMGIIMLTAMGTIDDKVRGFEEGADLYLVKPIDRRELIACINSQYQRLHPSNPRPTSGWQLHRSKRELHAPDSRCLDLTTQDLQVLSLLLEQAGVTRDRNELVTHLGFDYMHFPEGRTNTVISRLRQKLSKFSPDLRIMTIRSRGYAYVGPDIEIR